MPGCHAPHDEAADDHDRRVVGHPVRKALSLGEAKGFFDDRPDRQRREEQRERNLHVRNLAEATESQRDTVLSFRLARRLALRMGASEMPDRAIASPRAERTKTTGL